MDKTYIGLWLDHKRAVLTTYFNKNQKTESLFSKLEKWSKSTGGSMGMSPYNFNGCRVDDKKDHRRNHALEKYYAQILQKIKGADHIYLMGPGLAKKELLKYLEEHHMGDRISGFHAKDNLTTRQVAAETREFFHLVPSA